ncbi:hypothetical protein IM40_01280 [Candidatus Paracaedimonas acanthamoebae]|nr:hypothetical protein IM40_01280 [Candidatus Paracaedimonas acanthamoebae]
MISKVFLSLEILGTSPRMTRMGTKVLVAKDGKVLVGDYRNKQSFRCHPCFSFVIPAEAGIQEMPKASSGDR